MSIIRSIKTVLFTALAGLAPFVLAAQCDRVGWVTGSVPGCGPRIIDLDNGELILAVTGGEDLVGGQTITFTSEYIMPPAGCGQFGFPVVALTCVSDTLPCSADFTYVVDNLNPYQYAFSADLYSAATQTAAWAFGDGATATGVFVDHTFPSEGYYNVCLTVTDASGCSVTYCEDVYVSGLNPGWCGYDITVTAVGTMLMGNLVPAASNPGVLTNVQWFNSKTNQILSENQQFSYDLQHYGSYLICAQYEVENPDGSSCTNTRCQQLSVAEPGCVMPLLASNATICPPFFAPVCGCDGVTYGNECEAMAAGVTSWWAGACSGGTGNCGADFVAEILSGSPDTGYLVRFVNQSSGDYSLTQLDFGDGSPIFESTQWTSVVHHYDQGGIFRTNLSVWKTNNCISSVIRLVVTDAFHINTNMMPSGTDYVLPGDANGDKKANMYDLLNIGVGYNGLGAPRPNASTAWTPQFAPNWVEATGAGVNFKHLDCDGNGIVNEFDPGAIQQHYTPIDTTPVAWNPAAPQVWLEFDQDTIFLNPDNPMPVKIDADLMVGSSTQPVFGLYGFALGLRYPEYVNHDPATDYYDDSFFGFSNYILWLPRDNYSQRQLDMGFTHKQGSGASGYGRVARISFQSDFIIIIDIADRSSEKAIPFTVPIRGVKAVDQFGIKKDLTLPPVQDTVWIKILETTGTEESALSRSIHVYPNPAVDAVTLYTGDLEVELIEVRGNLGQVLQTIVPTGTGQHRLDISGLAVGVYTLQLQTNRGMATKKLVVH